MAREICNRCTNPIWFEAARVGKLPATSIYRRNFGEWKSLKQVLRIQEHDLDIYKRNHRNVTSKQIVDGFGRDDTGPWKVIMKPGVPPVRLFIRQMSDGPYIATMFANWQVAVFDLDTMWCTYSD
jgi:hypothetical protein